MPLGKGAKPFRGGQVGQGRGPGRPALLALVNGAIFLLVCLGLEVASQALFPRDLRAVFNDPGVFVRNRPFVVPDAIRGFALKPGYAEGGIHINSAGFRGPELPADLRSRELVLALGESSTFGWMVADSETYPAHLQQLLNRMQTARPICVVNAGVPSYTSPQVL